MFFSTIANRCGCCMAGGCFTDVVLNSFKNYHQEHATEPRRLPKSVGAAWGVVILHFREVQIINCGSYVYWTVHHLVQH